MKNKEVIKKMKILKNIQNIQNIQKKEIKLNDVEELMDSNDCKKINERAILYSKRLKENVETKIKNLYEYKNKILNFEKSFNEEFENNISYDINKKLKTSLNDYITQIDNEIIRNKNILNRNSMLFSFLHDAKNKNLEILLEGGFDRIVFVKKYKITSLTYLVLKVNFEDYNFYVSVEFVTSTKSSREEIYLNKYMYSKEYNALLGYISVFMNDIHFYKRITNDMINEDENALFHVLNNIDNVLMPTENDHDKKRDFDNIKEYVFTLVEIIMRQKHEDL